MLNVRNPFPMITAMIAMAVVNANVASAQRGGRPSDLLRRDDVRKELELVDDQITKLDILRQKRGERIRELYSGLKGLSREERNAKLRERFIEFSKTSQKEIDQVLLPHQAKRLAQLVIQYRLRGGTSRTLTSSQVSEGLGISDEQKARLQERATELSRELQEKFNKLRQEFREKLLEELTPQQRAKWKDMIGEPFEFQPQSSSRSRGGGSSRERPNGE